MQFPQLPQGLPLRSLFLDGVFSGTTTRCSGYPLKTRKRLKIKKGEIDDEAKNLWEIIEHQFALALKYHDKINIGLSGGIDSRLTMAAIPVGKTCNALTYGDGAHYEARIAQRIAKLKGATHKCFPVYDDTFPDKEKIKETLYKGESFNHAVWFSILNKWPLLQIEWVKFHL